MTAFPQRRGIFLIGLICGVVALAGFAALDSDRLALDLALSSLRRAREHQERALEETLARVAAAQAGGDAAAQAATMAVFRARFRVARRAEDRAYAAALDRVVGLGPAAAEEIFQRLQDPREPAWLLLYDTVSTELAGRRPATYREKLEAFERQALTGEDWPLRVRVAIHRPGASADELRQDLGLARHDAVPHLIALLASRNLFDRLAAAAALENFLNRPIGIPWTAEFGAWREAADRWREFWEASAQRSRVDLLAETLSDPDPVRRAHACRLLGESTTGATGGDSEAVERLIEAMQDADRRVRARAAGAMARLGRAAGRRALLDLAFENPDIESASDSVELEELRALGEAAAQALCDEVQSRRARSRPAYRRALLHLLKDQRAEQAKSLFQELAGGDPPEERRIALDALSDLGDHSDVALRRFVAAASDRSAAVRLSGARGLARLGVLDQSIPVLIALLGSSDEVIALAALAILREAVRSGPRIGAEKLQADQAAARDRWARWWAENDRRVQGMTDTRRE